MEPEWSDLTGAAEAAVRRHAIRTPVVEAPELSAQSGVRVLLKLESLQVTGSFKVRGAAARMHALTDEERLRGVVTCSSGNHGRAVAHVARALEMPAVICVPEWTDPVKLEGMRTCGAEVRLSGRTYDEAEARSLEAADAEGLILVHPFDDPWIIAGQATVAGELIEQAPEIGSVIVPLSGGGLAAGVAGALAREPPQVDTIAVSARRARVMVESLRSGRPVELPEEETLAGALSGGIGLENRFTFDLVREHVHDHVIVEEDEIMRAMRFAALELGLVLEGGGAVALAAVLEGRVSPTGPTAIVLSGGNVEGDVLRGVIESA